MRASKSPKRAPISSILSLLVALTATAIAPAQEPTHAGLLRFPDVSAERIVFSYAGDLWTVGRAGGLATPLAGPAGREGMPRFSPDGRTVAFMGNYDGGADLYTLPVEGGRAHRVSHHPGFELLCDWTPDGRLLFQTSSFAGLARRGELWSVDAEGGLPTKMPISYGFNGSVSPDGQWLAFTNTGRDSRTWKRYMGGMASDVWLYNLRDGRSLKITDWGGTDSLPMWHGRTVYYVSDAGPEHRLNIWSYPLDSGRRSQVTHFTDYDVKWPAAGPGPHGQGEIVFQLGDELQLLDLVTRRARAVQVRIPGDASDARPRTVDVAGAISSTSISPSGNRVAVEARGDIWSLPADKGVARNLTGTDGVAERSPAWSPDGRWIAYFSDATGEYQVYLAQSDGKGEIRQLTTEFAAFLLGCSWSPDSKQLAIMDKGGQLFLHDVDAGTTRLADQSPDGQPFRASWSHDSKWLTYARGNGRSQQPSIWLLEAASGAKHQVTSDMFADSDATFDRKGDWLYFASTRTFTPTYSELDTTFVYLDSQNLLAVPLRNDVKNPFAPTSDEESWDKAKKDEDEGEAESADAAGDADQEAAADPAPALEDDGLSGTWEGAATGPDPLPPGGMPITIYLELSGTAVSGSMVSPIMTLEIASGSFDKASGVLTLVVPIPETSGGHFLGTVENDDLTGILNVEGQDFQVKATRTERADFGIAAASGAGQDDAKKDAKDKPVKDLVIDLDGFESRAIQLPVARGRFGNLAVNGSNQLLYVRNSSQGAPGGIKLFDIADDKHQEQTVAAAAGGFEISANGKKLLAGGSGGGSIYNAAAGSSGKPVPTAGMQVVVDPRAEWRQMFTEAWRLHRDLFYDPNMHGVDWPAMHARYLPMVEQCTSRADLDYVLGELVAELNVGHAYIRGGGDDGEAGAPDQPVGLLGCDFELDQGAYRIARIVTGAPFDADARGPLSQPGVDVHQGDYLLAVDGRPVDVARDPWAAFLGKTGGAVELTVSSKPQRDDEARTVLVTPLRSDSDLRYRDWIESNRRKVAEATGGRVGYVYVPDTGQRGQNDLFEQFYGQAHLDALIIDERWNGGGQIPTRFIELLNRPVTNYWATRDGHEGKGFQWPPDSHQGPKCMLINGFAGSGGDAFPAYFKRAGLGKLIGARTWGGLVGISGNPNLIDGGGITVPTFAYYETDGTWGIEGHGVEPDIAVEEDPAVLATGADPQLDAAIAHMLRELERNPYVAPARPAYPDRSGMGLPDADK
ncbi:MAG TPA: PDZ domain-containing protein [Planctomycetota bacterium]